MVNPPAGDARRLLKQYNSSGKDSAVETLTSVRNVDTPVSGSIIVWGITMSEQVKAKVELNKVTHSVRAAQAVLQYGVGAMVDFRIRHWLRLRQSTGVGQAESMMIALPKPLGWTTLLYPPTLRTHVFLNGISARSVEDFSR